MSPKAGAALAAGLFTLYPQPLPHCVRAANFQLAKARIHWEELKIVEAMLKTSPSLR